MPTTIDFPVCEFKTQQELRSWFEKNHATEGIWLRLYKKHSGAQSVTYDQAVEEALCFGWIDGQVKKYDEQSWIQRFTPRRSKSNWSKVNTEKAERFIREGKMAPSGLAQIEAAKADGRWQRAYEPSSKAKPPEDFMRELGLNKNAQEFFNTLNKANTYAIYYRLQSAKNPESRQNRIKMIIAMLEQGKKFHE